MVERTLSEEAAKRVLARSIELDDQRGFAYSIPELREIAAEAGVSAVAFDRALQEIQSAAVPRADLKTRLLGVGTVGLLLGVTTGVVDVTTYFASSPIAMGVTLMAVAGLGVLENFRRPFRGLLRFGLNASAVWLGYASAWIVITTVAGGAGSYSTLLMWRTTAVGVAISVIFGIALSCFHVMGARGAAGSGAPLELTLKQRIAGKLKSWIDAWANRVEVDAGSGGLDARVA